MWALAKSKVDHSSALQEKSANIALVKSTLETLLRFLNWSPLGYIFETKLISSLICKVGVGVGVCGCVCVCVWEEAKMGEEWFEL